MRTIPRYLILFYCLLMIILIINKLCNIVDNVLYQESRVEAPLHITAPKLPTTARFFRDEDKVENGYGLNLHLWYGMCSTTIEKLCGVPSFPEFPAIRVITSKTFISWQSEDYGQRVFGYLLAPTTGSYSFAIASDDSSELWLSTDENWKNSILIARVGTKNTIEYCPKGIFTKFRSQVSENVNLEKGKTYYIEMLHTQTKESNRLELVWKTPGSSDFEFIKQEYLSPYIINTFSNYSNSIPPSVSCSEYDWFFRGWTTKGSLDGKKQLYLRHEKVHAVLPTCDLKNKPHRKSFNQKKVKQWEAVHHHISNTYTFPYFTHPDITDVEDWRFPLDENEARYISYNFMHRLEMKYPK